MDADCLDALARFSNISRRTLLKGTAALSAATGFAPLVAGRATAQGKTLMVWGGVSSSEAGDALLRQQMQAWGAEHGFAVEYVTWPLPDYATELATAVEAGDAPDVVMMLQGVSSQSTITLFYAEQGRLVDLTDVYNALKDLGGGMYETLLPWVEADGKIYSIPMQSDVSVMHARLDLIEAATGARSAGDARRTGAARHRDQQPARTLRHRLRRRADPGCPRPDRADDPQ